jgi:UDP-N-acetylglucosamine diphosphorylase/glucosamine-1-phosphate N-acetyltransferase
MDSLLLDEAPFTADLFPFTWTRDLLDIRVGILTLREKWARLLPSVRFLGPEDRESDDYLLGIPANILPNRALADALHAIPDAKSLWNDGHIDLGPLAILDETPRIQYPWDIFQHNNQALNEDFQLVAYNRPSQSIPPTVQVIGEPSSIFLEPGARLSYCILNTSAGPIYIGQGAEVQEGTIIRGPAAICEGALVKMGTLIYGATTIGPHCVVGGEIKNSVLFGFSNKGHEGYLGDSVIGEWCNLGAGTSNSNLKNNAGLVRVWNPASGQMVEAGLKCGLFMGDYSRSAINTSFNTGTLVGVCSNVFGEGLTPSYIRSFRWGQAADSPKYLWENALRDVASWKKLKGHSLTEREVRVLQTIFERS